MQPTEKVILSKTFLAESAITKGKAVVLGTSESQVKPPAAAGAKCIGIALHDAAAGYQVEVCMLGVCAGYADGAFSKGDSLQAADTNGELDTAASGDYPLALALQAASAAGDLVEVFVNPGMVPLA